MRDQAFAVALGLALAGAAGRAASAQGAGTVLLPQLQRTARSLALGDGAAHIEGLNALGVNPAALSVARPEAVFQFQQLAQDTQAGLLGVAYPVRPIGATLGVTYLELRSAGFDRRNELGDASGTFDLQDRLVGVHASRSFRIDDGLKPLDVGLSYKTLFSRIDSYSATGHAVDAGLRFALQSVPLTLGFSARNIGKGPTYVEQESRLPTSYLLSAAYRIGGPFTLLAGVNRLVAERSNEYSVGFEAWARAPLTLRAHYTFAPGGPGSAGTQNLAGGLGFNLYRYLSMDYAFQPFDSSLRAAGTIGTHRLTLTMRLGRAVSLEEYSRGPGEVPREVSRYIMDAPPPEGYPSELERRAQELAQRGYAAMKQGRFALAVLRFRQAHDADPRNDAVRASLSRLERAAAILPEAVGAETAMLYARQGVFRYVVGASPRLAVTELRRAFNEDPSREAVLALLNLVERESGFEASRRAVDQQDRDLVSEKIKGAREAAYEGRYGVAIQRCQDVLDVEPRNALALSVMGTVYYLMQDMAKAMSAWKRAFEIDPSDEVLAETLRRFSAR